MRSYIVCALNNYLNKVFCFHIHNITQLKILLSLCSYVQKIIVFMSYKKSHITVALLYINMSRYTRLKVK